MNSKLNGAKTWIKGLVTWNWAIILLISVFQRMTHFMMTTATGPYITSIGLSGTVLGAAASVYTFTCILCRPFAGALTDRVNPKKLLAAVFLLRGLTCVMYMFTNSMVMFFLTRFMQGVAFAALGCCLPAMTSRCVSLTAVGAGLSITFALQKLLASLGPVWSRALYANYGFKTAYMVIGLICLVPVALVFLLRENKDAENVAIAKDAAKEKKPFNPLKGICWAGLGIAGMGFFLIIPYYASDMFGQIYFDSIGLNYAEGLAIASAFGTIYGLVIGFVVDAMRKKPLLLVIPAVCMLTAFLIILSTATKQWQINLAACLYYFGWNACDPIVLSTLFRVVPRSQAGAASSTWYLMLDISGVIMNPVIGVLGDSLGAVSTFRIAAAAPVLALVVFIIFGMPLIKKVATKEKLEAEAAAAQASV